MAMMLDGVQQRILAGLQANARMTNRALASLVGLAPSSTLSRVRDLEDRRIIRGYHAEVDLEALGRPIQAMVMVSLVHTDEATVEGFMEAVHAMPEVVSVFLIGGKEDALVHVAVPDVQWLRQTVLSKISGLPSVAEERTSLIFEHVRTQILEPLGEAD